MSSRTSSNLRFDRPVVEAMEPRLLFSADIAPLALALSDMAQMGAHVQTLAPAQTAFLAASEGKLAEWIFIDSGVPDLQSFLRDFDQQSREGRPVHVVVIEASEDGLSRISQSLADQHDIGAIHIISHGSQGVVQLGAVTLDAVLLQQRAGEVAQWGAALSEEADLLLYGCHTAAQDQGLAFMQDLAALTGADVAASTDLTGAGGNWTLERSIGQVNTTLAVSTPLSEQWAGQLAQVTATPSSKGQGVWSDATGGAPVSSQWDGRTTAPSAPIQASNNWTVITSASAPDGRSAIVLGVDTNGAIQGERWTGTKWESLPALPTVVATSSFRQGFAVAYEQVTGEAMVVWNNGATLQYTTLTSTGWTDASNVMAYTGTVPQRLQIAAQPKGDQLLLTISDDSFTDHALIWTGTAWDHQVTLDAKSGDFLQQLALSPVYESLSRDAMAVYGKDGESTLYYRVFSNNAWSSEASISLGISGQPVTIVTASDPNSDRIGLGVMSTLGSGSNRQETFARWSGSAWEAVTQINGSTSIGGTSVSVAFESRSGDLLAAYIGGGDTPSLLTLAASANTWSSPINGPDMGSDIGAIRLFADPASDHIMLGIQASNRALTYIEWGGQTLASPINASSDTDSAYTPAFTWFWQPQTDSTANIGLWMGGASNSTGWPGLNQTSNTEILTVDAQGLTLGPNVSSGTFSHGWNPAAFGATSLDDVVWVSQPVALLNGFNLQRGDILFTTNTTTLLQSTNSVTVNSNDVVRFRPTVSGDYSSGNFTEVFSSLGAGLNGNGSTPDIKGLALVEQDVVIGDKQLRAGDFLFTAGNGSTARDIYVQSYSAVGLFLVSSTTRLLAGNDLGISQGIASLEVITVATNLGGQSLAKGELLITLDGADTIGDNDLEVEPHDVIRLALTRTSVNASAIGNASLLLDGEAMGTPKITVDGLALIQAASPLIISGDNPSFEVNAAENQLAVTTVKAQDSQGGSNVTYAIGGGADANMFTIDATGTLQFKSQHMPDYEARVDADQDGVYDVVVTASQGSLADQQRIRVTITDVNEAPVMDSSTLNLPATELQAATTTLGTLNAKDPESQTLSYSISGGADASFFQIDSSTGDLRFKNMPDTLAEPFLNHALTYAVQVAASDGTFTATRNVVVGLNKVNRPPENTLPAQPDSLEDKPRVLQGLSVSDQDAGQANLTVTLSVSSGTLSLNTQVANGVQANQIQVMDGGKTLVIQASTSAINASLSDAAGLIHLPQQDAHGVITLTMVSDDGGNSGLPQQPELRTDTDTINFSVQAVNDTPVVDKNGAMSTNEGQSATLTQAILRVTDVDHTSNELLYSLTTSPSHGYLALAQAPQTALTGQGVFTQSQINDGEVFYVHDGSESLMDSLQLSVSDGNGGLLTGITIQIGINSVNDAPQLQSAQSVEVIEGQSSPLSPSNLAFTDTDNAPTDLIYSITQGATRGYLARVDSPSQALAGADAFTQAQVDAGQIIYVHDGSEGKADTVTLSLRDGQGGQINGIVLALDVKPLNDNPVLETNAGLSVNEGQSAALSTALLHVTDADNPATELSYSLITPPGHGYLALAQAPQMALTAQSIFTQAQIDAGDVIYVHDGTETLQDSLVLRLDDGAGGALTSIKVQINISGVNDAPTLESLNDVQVIEGQTATLNRLQLAFTDPDSAPAELLYSITQGASHGYLALVDAPGQPLTGVGAFSQAQVDAGQVIYVHDGSDTLSDTVILSLGDGHMALAQSITLAVQVQGVNDTSTPAETPSNGPVTVPTALATAIDTPSDDETDSAQPQGATVGNAQASPPMTDAGNAPLPNQRARAAIVYTPPLEALADTLGSMTLQPGSLLPQVAPPKSSEQQAPTEEASAFSFRWTGSLQVGQTTQALSRTLAELRETLTDGDDGRRIPLMTSSIAVSTGLSVGYVIWLVRGGALLGSMLSSMPLWNMVDPLPVLSRSGAGAHSDKRTDDEDTPLENLFDGQAETNGNTSRPMPPSMASPRDASAPPDAVKELE